nr:hypothetical protein [uncultured Ruegeria sp.]
MPFERVVVALLSVVFLASSYLVLYYVWPPGLFGFLGGEHIYEGMSPEEIDRLRRWETFSEIAPIVLGMVVSGVGLIVTILVSLGKSKRERERHVLEIRKLNLEIKQLQNTK